ncbi:MAG: sugar phosphate isomerase/epimerase [Planctomycetota bacterium]|nr:sugar phosphate isomerase/epimerase [Planctomycetota bacterium]
MANPTQPAGIQHGLKTCFVTRICPEWTVAAIIDAMKQYGYLGVELQVAEGNMHGVELDADKSAMADVRKQFDEADLAVACLSTPLTLSAPDPRARAKAVEQVKAYMVLADSLGAPYVSLPGGNIPAGMEPPGVIDYICEALDDICSYAEEKHVRSTLLVATNDAFSHSKYLKEVIRQVYSPKLGILWDVVHPIRVLEQVEDTYEIICDHVRHVHVHDMAFNDDRTQVFLAEPGRGFVPFGKIIEMLRADGFRGYLSVAVTEKQPDPDRILPAYAEFLGSVLNPSPAK